MDSNKLAIIIANYLDIDVNDLYKLRGGRAVSKEAEKQNINLALQYIYTDQTMPELARRYGHKSHTSIIYALKIWHERLREENLPLLHEIAPHLEKR